PRPRPCHPMSVPPPATPRAEEPIAPIEHGDAYAVTLREFGGIRLDLMLAGLAPHDDAAAASGRTAERHRRTRFGFQRWRPAQRLLAAVVRGGSWVPNIHRPG